MAYKVFLSYSTSDLEVAESVQRILNSADVNVFLAERSIAAGDSLPKKIQEAIEACDLFIVLWSRNSRESEWVRHETGMAHGCKRDILPVLLDNDAPTPPPLQLIKYIPAYDDSTKAFETLRDNVRARAGIKQRNNALGWLALGAVVVMAMRE